MKRLIILSVMLFAAITVYGPQVKQDPRRYQERWLSSTELNHENLRLAMELNAITAPEVVIAQSLLETGYFRSELCTSYNNLFGMKRPGVRATTAVGADDKGYAIYACWYDSVKDIKLFQEWYTERGKDLSDYYAFLATIGYAEDEHYLHKIQQLCITSR